MVHGADGLVPCTVEALRSWLDDQCAHINHELWLHIADDNLVQYELELTFKVVQCMPSSFFCSSFFSSCSFSFSHLHSFLLLCPLSFLSQLLLCFISDFSFILFSLVLSSVPLRHRLAPPQ